MTPVPPPHPHPPPLSQKTAAVRNHINCWHLSPQKTAALVEKQKKLEAARNIWQPPKRDSESEEESDDDMIQDDDR